MITTVAQLIEALGKEFDPNERVAYTIYSKADMLSAPNRKTPDSEVAEVWDKELIFPVDEAIENAQWDINNYMEYALRVVEQAQTPDAYERNNSE